MLKHPIDVPYRKPHTIAMSEFLKLPQDAVSILQQGIFIVKSNPPPVPTNARIR